MSPSVEFDHTLCSDLSQANKLEWLETNGIGGFASSTITGLNTRRYHGLLVAALKPPVGRYVLLSKLEEALVLDGKRFELGANQYPGAIHPQGHLLLQSFRLDPFPVFTYLVDDVEIEKSVYLVHGENTAVIQYELFGDLAGRSVELEVYPLIAFRDFHCTTHANPAIRTDVIAADGIATVMPYEGLPALHFAHDGGAIEPRGFWCFNFEYERERERGLDFREDLYSPFRLRFNLARSGRASVIASTVAHEASEAQMLEEEELERRNRTGSSAPGDVFTRVLASAADQFIVSRSGQNSVIAGYHWFSDWGRDTMISLPGLTLATGRFEVARNILRAFVRSMDQGMLPNRFPDAGEQPEYNTVDATLWMFHAVSEFLRYTGDYQFVGSELYPALAGSIAWHERGTRYGIRADFDGLLEAGQEGVQLTWMDAKVGDWVVTPRQGKPVEVQALWYNALCVMQDLARVFNEPEQAAHYGALSARCRASFEASFWNEQEGCLYDVLGPDGPDRAIRPNQIFAVSLPHALLEGEKARRVVDVVEWELLTPYGLRTLSPRDPNYQGRYEGDPRTRDAAYHQGTVWPWLLGPFLTAYLKVHGRNEEVCRRADDFLDPLRNHLWQAGLGQISEIFDGDIPHCPAGCIAQAWSIAEALRISVEDLNERRPSAQHEDI